MRTRLIAALLLLPGLLFAQNRVQNYINRQLKTDSLFINAAVGILAVDENGKDIASWNGEMPLLTASTMKTITTGVAIEVLGPDFKFSTKVAFDGCIMDDGTLNGDLYIVGGGDPTLGSHDKIAFPIDSIFAIWADAIAEAGIKRINGSIIGDDRFFIDENIPDSWAYGNLGYYYGSGPSGLSYAENLSRFEIEPGATVGDPVKITPLPPYSPKMTYINEVITGPEKSRDGTEYYVTNLAPVGKFVGTFAVDMPKRVVTRSNRFGPSTCAGAFESFLTGKGIPSRGVNDVASLRQMGIAVPDQNKLTYLAETFSPELIEIINVTNTISNNFYAETMLKMLGKALVDNSYFYASTEAVEQYLRDHGVDTYGLCQDDGSGLSRENYVSPRFFTNFYNYKEQSATFAQYFESFPGPGRPGTLEGVLKEEKKEIKEIIRAKSGSLSSVRCYAGYVKTKKGYIKFAILVNNFDCPTSAVQPKIEGFMRELAKYGNGNHR